MLRFGGMAIKEQREQLNSTWTFQRQADEGVLCNADTIIVYYILKHL